MAGKTLYDKLWEAHEVKRRDDGSSLIYIDRHIIHEVTSPQAFEGLRLANRKPWRIDTNIATPDHNVPTTPERKGGIEAIVDQVSRLQVQTLDENCDEYGIVEFKMNDERQGIVHVISGAGGHLAWHDRGLRRLAHLHPWRLRCLAHALALPRLSTCSPPSAWSPRR